MARISASPPITTAATRPLPRYVPSARRAAIQIRFAGPWLGEFSQRLAKPGSSTLSSNIFTDQLFFGIPVQLAAAWLHMTISDGISRCKIAASPDRIKDLTIIAHQKRRFDSNRCADSRVRLAAKIAVCKRSSSPDLLPGVPDEYAREPGHRSGQALEHWQPGATGDEPPAVQNE